MVHPHSNLEIQYDEDASIVMSNASANTAVLGASKIDASRENGFRIIKSKVNFGFHSKTVDEGPVVFGMAIGMTAAQIKAALEDDPQISSAVLSKSKSMWLKPLGVVPFTAVEEESAVHRLMTIPVGWSVIEGSLLSYWGYAQGALTTGMVITIFAEHLGVWLRD